MTPRVRFSVLGPMRAWRDDREVDLGSPQQQATLAVLLLREGHLTLSTELISAIWGDDPPRAAAGTIRTYISRLRRSLVSEDDAPAVGIDSLGGGYALRLPDEALDLARYRNHVTRARAARKNTDPASAAAELRAAIALWNGTPLAGVPGPYAEGQRSALLQSLLTTRVHRLTAELELGHHTEATGELAMLAEEHPLREQFRELLMLALYRSGRQAEALEVFGSVQRHLADELGIDPGPRLQTLHRRILGGDPKLLGPTTGPVPIRQPPNGGVDRRKAPAPVVPPHQLPADLPDFTGRRRVLADLTEILTRPDSVPVVTLAGMGGVGKTALAVHAAHAVRTHFPDGQVFVTLNALGTNPADPYEVLADLLRAFSVPEPVPDTLDQRAALWRTTLSGRRVLIVLDDARDTAHVRELLPATPGSAVILTGRRLIQDLAGSYSSTLDVFDPDEALALFGRMAGRNRVEAEPAAARDLAAVCSHLPHAVRLLGARLVARPHWSLADFSHRLADEMSQQSTHYEECVAVAAPFARGYRHLDSEQARAFRSLAVPDCEQISTAAAAATLELPEDVAESLLESLADLHLIGAGSRGQYHYVNLVRLYARHRAYAEDGVAACREVVERYNAHLGAVQSRPVTLRQTQPAGTRAPTTT
jgi:DNA-binding SARP family transcriptional activator